MSVSGGGQKLAAALYIRYKGRANSITVNGVDTPLVRLGHNAQMPSGWHPCVLEVPAATTYTLSFSGQISLIAQCVRVVSGGDSGGEPT